METLRQGEVAEQVFATPQLTQWTAGGLLISPTRGRQPPPRPAAHTDGAQGAGGRCS
jgi:hypothetical protein